VPAQIPIVGGRLIFKVYDEDTLSDELIGAVYYNLKDIIPDANGKEGKLNNKFDWKNIYGAPVGVSGKWADNMNNNPEIASLWKGRMLVQCVAVETDKPKLLLQNLENDVIDEAKDCHEERTYALRCFFYGALCLPKNN